ncbi:ABC transporter permease [Porphyromonadaceae bacterium W3.11]|nr:ABC transporter permease [Porphyromonadaceae bacterium W3.11]
MIKKYFKQAWWLLKENKLYSTIYIIGTALAICMVMAISVFIHIKCGNIEPEVNRSRSLYTQGVTIISKDGADKGTSSAFSSLQTVREIFYPLQSAEVVTAYLVPFGEDYTVSRVGDTKKRPLVIKFTDANYWKAFRFDFIEGVPYDDAVFSAGDKKIVIDEMTSRRLFNGASAIGESLILNGELYKVTGVVRNRSYLLNDTFANAWVPYTTNGKYEDPFDREGILGFYNVIVVAPSAAHFAEVRKEVEDNLRRYEEGLSYNIDLKGQPDDAFTTAFRIGNYALNINKVKWTFAIMLLIFALVPLLNLSGLNSSRMEKRASEFGVRKAFGGTRGQLTVQLITENLLLTVLGGLLGFIISYFLLQYISTTLVSPLIMVSSSDVYSTFSDNAGITSGMMLNLEVFLVALVAVFVINMLSTLIPSYRYAKRNIVDSLSEHKH